MIYSLFNYTKLFLWSIFFYIDYKIYDKCNINLLNIFLYNVQNTNVLAIKCIQKLIPYLRMTETNEKIIKTLSKVYEQNIYHSDKDTLKIYKKDFNEIFSKKYEIISSISSGSIGQVYKIKDIHSDKFYAMKVIHPNVKYHIKFITTMIWLFTLQNYMFFELDQFINNFISETDFKNEVLNMKQFYEYYKDNNNIIIPQVYKWSKNIIIMDFIEGKIITELSIYERSKYITLSLLFFNNNRKILNLNHGDLHLGNFKKYKDNKIVIYDFGFCFSIDDSKIVEIFDIFYYHLIQCNKDLEYSYEECILYILKYNLKNYDLNNYKNDIQNMFLKTKFNDMKDFTKIFFKFIINNRIIINIGFLNLLIISWYSIEQNDSTTSDKLSFCQTYDIFNDYQKILKEDLTFKENNINNHEYYQEIKKLI